MATWNGTKPTKYMEYTGADYAQTELTWRYSTSSDILALKFKQGEYSDYYSSYPAREFEQLMGNDRAMAILEQLADWCDKYNGPEYLDKIIKRIRE